MFFFSCYNESERSTAILTWPAAYFLAWKVFFVFVTLKKKRINPCFSCCHFPLTFFSLTQEPTAQLTVVEKKREPVSCLNSPFCGEDFSSTVLSRLLMNSVFDTWSWSVLLNLYWEKIFYGTKHWRFNYTTDGDTEILMLIDQKAPQNGHWFAPWSSSIDASSVMLNCRGCPSFSSFQPLPLASFPLLIHNHKHLLYCNWWLLVIERKLVQWQISSAVLEVQEAVLQQEPRLAKAMIPVPTLHITLLVTHLANQDQVDRWVVAHAHINTNTQNKLNNIYTHKYTPEMLEVACVSLPN